MLKTTGISASIVSVVCLLASMPFYHRGPQDSSVVSHGFIVAVDFLSLALFVSINLALAFSLSFTPILGVEDEDADTRLSQGYPDICRVTGSIRSVAVVFFGFYFTCNFTESPLMKPNASSSAPLQRR
jgi:hypothetical protein